MKYDAVLFDLDGTLTDSGEGIMNCARLAMNHFGIDVTDAQLRTFIGPPLRDTFTKYGLTEAQAEEAVEIYRSRYNTVGKFENAVYPGIEELLQNLKDQGLKLFVATSKPEITAIEILVKFDLAKYFDVIAGASEDNSRNNKDDVIRYLIDKADIHGQMIMVGDTVYDIVGARKAGIECIAVTWGYGDLENMLQEKPIAVVDSCHKLQNELTK